MFNLQGSEIIVILLLALVVLGPEKLPDAVRRFMQAYNELRKMGQGFQSELKSALDEPMRELRDTAKLIKDNADPNQLFAEASAESRLEQAATPDAPAAPADDLSTDVVSTDVVSTDVVSTDDVGTHAVSTDDVSTDDVSTRAVSTDVDTPAPSSADEAPMGVVDPGSSIVGVAGSPPVRPASTVQPIRQPDRLDDGEAASA